MSQEDLGHGRTHVGCARMLPHLGGTGAWAGLVSVGSWSQPSRDTKGQGAFACRRPDRRSPCRARGSAWKRVSSGGGQMVTFAPISASAGPGDPRVAPGPGSVPSPLVPRPTPAHGSSLTACVIRSSQFSYFFIFWRWPWTGCVFLYGV